jgi:hypothetical protein
VVPSDVGILLAYGDVSPLVFRAAIDNLFDWHFTIRGPPDTPFEGGMYHGRIILPSDYPFRPPNIMLLTVGYAARLTGGRGARPLPCAAVQPPLLCS